MRSLLFCCLFFQFLPLASLAQPDAVQLIETASDERLLKAKGLPDGSFILVGQHNGSNALLTKLNANRQVVWSKTFATSGTESFHDVVQLNDGGYVAIGRTDGAGSGDRDYLVTRTDLSGNLVWSRTYGISGNDDGAGIDTTADGNLVICGRGRPGPGGFAQWIMKINLQGGVIWTRTYGANGHDGATSIRTLSDGNYLVTGTLWGRGSNTGLNDGTLLKISSSGSLIWRKYFGDASNDGFNDVVELSDGSLVACGYYTNGSLDPMVIKTDANGNIQWQKRYQTPGNSGLAKIAVDGNGGFVVSGYGNDIIATGADDILMGLDANGNVLWSNAYGSAGTETSGYLAVDANGEVWNFGTTDTGSMAGSNVYLFRPDVNGTGGSCFATAWQPTVSNLSVVNSVAGSLSSSGGSTTSPTLTVSNITMMESTLCSSSASNTPNLIAHYPLGCSINDASGNGFDGSGVGFVSGSDRFGFGQGATEFDGSNDYFTVPNTPAISQLNRFTFSAWVKPNTVSHQMIFLNADGPDAVDNAFWLRQVNGVFVIEIGNGSTVADVTGPTVAPFVGEWVHLVTTYDSSALRLFVDGQLYDSTLTVMDIKNTTSAFDYGRFSGFPYYWNGAMDDLRWYDDAMDAAQVEAL